MTYLGNAPSAGGFVFMWSPNNVLFYATHCIFDETLFLKCSTQVPQPVTRLQCDAPTHSHHQEDVEEESAHPCRIPVPPKQRTVVGEEQTSVPGPVLPETVPPPRTPSPRPEQRIPMPAPPPAPKKQRKKALLPPPQQQPQREWQFPEWFRGTAEQPKEWTGVKGPVPVTEENNPKPPVPVPGPSQPPGAWDPCCSLFHLPLLRKRLSGAVSQP